MGYCGQVRGWGGSQCTKVVQCGRHTVFVDGLSNVSTAGPVSTAFRVG